MIHKTIQKQSTKGKNRIYREQSTIASSLLIRDKLIQAIKQKAVGSELSAVDNGDRFVIHDIMKRVKIFAS